MNIMFYAKLIEPPINDFESNKVMVVLIDNFMLNLQFPLKPYISCMLEPTWLVTCMDPWKLNPFLPFKCPALS
jgi:hypothetical protein